MAPRGPGSYDWSHMSQAERMPDAAALLNQRFGNNAVKAAAALRTAYENYGINDWGSAYANNERAAARLAGGPGSPSGPGRWGNGAGSYQAALDAYIASLPTFDAKPYESAKAGIDARAQAAQNIIAGEQKALSGKLAGYGTQYQQTADKLKQDIAAANQAAVGTQQSDVAAIQKDLANQGVNAQAVNAQAQAQARAQAQQQQRQQDYLARLAQLNAQNQQARQAAADQLFAGLNSQAALNKNSLVGQVDAQQLQAKQAFDKARQDAIDAFGKSARGGSSSGGGGRSFGGGGGGFDPTGSQLWGLNQKVIGDGTTRNALQARMMMMARTPYERDVIIPLLLDKGMEAQNRFEADINAVNNARDKRGIGMTPFGVTRNEWYANKNYENNINDIIGYFINQIQNAGYQPQYANFSPGAADYIQGYGMLTGQGGPARGGMDEDGWAW